MLMNLTILIIVSLPEAFLNLIITLLFAGLKKRLSINKPNAIRFCTTLILMLAATWFVRPIVPNVVVSFIAHFSLYSIIIISVYRIRALEALYGVAVLIFLFSTFENVYYPYLVTYFFKGMESYQSSSINIIMSAIPTRIFQIVLVRLFWRHIDALEIMKLDRKFYNIFSVSFFTLTFAQCFLSYFFVAYFGNISLPLQIIYSVALLLIMLVFNVLVYSFIYVAVKGIIKKGYRQYQNLEIATHKAFSEAYRLLENNDIKGATSLIGGYAKNKAEEKRG